MRIVNHKPPVGDGLMSARRQNAAAVPDGERVDVRAKRAIGVRRIWLSRSVLVLCSFALVIAACRDADRPTIVYVARHAEKSLDGGDDPPLSDKGAQRAQALALKLGDADVRAIYVTQFKRTLDSAAPLAEQIGIDPSALEVDHRDPRPYVERLADDITAKHRGETVVVISHSNTLPLIVERLGGEPVPAIGDQVYGDLFVVTLPADGEPGSIAKSHYGD